MKLRLFSLFATVAVTLASSPASQSQVHVDMIAVTGGSCHAVQFLPQPLPEPTIFSDGSVANPTANAQYHVVCDVPRQDLLPQATGGTFFVSGSNFPGQRTICTVASFRFDGVFLGSASFVDSGERYDRGVLLNRNQLPRHSFAVLTCNLPPNGMGRLFGVTSFKA